MSDVMVVDRITADPQFDRLCGQMRPVGGVTCVTGLWGSSAPLVASEVARRAGRPLFYLTSHLEQADQSRDDLEFFAGRPVELLSAWETLPGEGPGAGEVDAERVRLCATQWSGAEDGPPLIVAPIQAVMQPVPSPAALALRTRKLAGGASIVPDELLGWLAEHGFERLDLVEAPGDFARRGDIIDIFCPGDAHPVRVELFGDQIESIRVFDVSSQRSIRKLASLTIRTVRSGSSAAEEPTALFLDYLPPESVVVVDDPSAVQEMGALLHERLGGPDALFTVEHVLREVQRFTQVHLARFGGDLGDSGETLHLPVQSLARFEGPAAEVVGELVALADRQHVLVVCDNDGERKRLTELVHETADRFPKQLRLELGSVHRGFAWSATDCVVVGHHELFHRMRQPRRIRRVEATRAVESWLELQPGDVVVHTSHGIARLRAIETMKKAGSSKVEEYLTLEFADKAVLHVPASQIDLVQKYVGSAGTAPQLSKLGGNRWSRTKERVSESVAELAESLLRIQAARHAHEGIAYPLDTRWQREFEESFPFDETEDQLLVAEDVKRDLADKRPMDRLLCGDVGYGKTELAMRAAFKVIEYGKQVAVLVPTTVLAEQHFLTFRERMADYPFSVGCLSRFRTPQEIRRLLEDMRTGRVDIVIGTHRLLSKDVQFADLGLMVIDEEQRFGVEHKERLKRFRETIEVLTMTATPIPRTLHMAMLGIRDISSLSTPPVDRRAIATQVARFDEGLIRRAIVRELNRDGQVFFVHNRVRNIETVAATVARIVPEARVVFGHGQMADRELEQVMGRFLRREAEVLVATTIIESGIDIPSANTIFINEADRYGLSDLHQLRGRVGRSGHRAYCYLLLPRNRSLTPKAARRLKAIEEFSELGAGFRIAMRDLEIRGAGNILGPEQSGHIAAVGYDMYCRLLDNAVRRLRDEPESDRSPVHLELGIEAFVPRSYVASERARIDIYRRTVNCASLEELAQLESDIRDAFGRMPKPVERLLALADIRVRARQWKIVSILASEPDIVFTVSDLARVQPLFAKVTGTVRMPDPKTVYLRLRSSYFEPPTLLGHLRRLLTREIPVVETVSK